MSLFIGCQATTRLPIPATNNMPSSHIPHEAQITSLPFLVLKPRPPGIRNVTAECGGCDLGGRCVVSVVCMCVCVFT